MTEQQKALVTPILNTITNDEIREFAEVLLNDMPQYIWEVGASSTGKYHPAYSLGVGGLMRHQIAVVRFLNFFFELEQYSSKLTNRQMDLMRIGGLCHDMMKSGTQADYEHSRFTKFDHPLQAANTIRSYEGKYLNHDELEFIASCIESHMGQWCLDKKTSKTLPKPQNGFQKLVHLADYLASRKDLTMSFDGYEQPEIELPDINTYVLTFGKYKDQKLIDVWPNHRDYFAWCEENNVLREPVRSLVEQLKKGDKTNE